MNRLIQFAIACCFSLAAFAANPSFNSFAPTQFDVTGNRVALTNGVIVTNIVIFGTQTNLLEVWDQDGALKFFIDTNGYSHPQLWTNISGTITASLPVTIGNSTGLLIIDDPDDVNSRYSALTGAYLDGSFNSSILFLLDPKPISGNQAGGNYVFDTYTNQTSGNLFAVKNQGTNKFVVPWDGAIQVPGNSTFSSIYITNGATFASGANVTSGNITNAGDYIGTIDPTVTGTTLKLQKSLKLQFPRYIDNAGCTYSNTNDYTALTFMLPQFSGTGATNANYCDFAFRVPADLDTSKDLTGSLTIRLTAADTGAHTYDVGMVSIANSSAAAGTPANYVALTISGDGSGASGDIESVSNVTLTSWRSSMTAGQWCLLRLNRDGANDASTVASNLMELEIFYWATQ